MRVLYDESIAKPRRKGNAYMNNFFTKFTAILSGGLLGLFLCGCGAGRPVFCQYVDTAMGTVVQQSLYAPDDKETADSFSDMVMSILNQMEEKELSWRLETSEIYAVNKSAGSEDGYLLSEEMTRVIIRCLDVSRKAEGAFDITIGSVVCLWNIDGYVSGEQTGKFQPPDGEILKRILQKSSYENLKLAGETFGEDGEILQARIFLPTGMQLDLGAAAKGLALERILEELTDSGLDGAVISVGGSVLTYGEKPDHTDWKVGIVDPVDTAKYIGTLSLRGQWCVSTSGDYERYVEVDGRRFHHIIDPATGMPADNGVHSVTILTKDGMLSDALSTACFVLGVEEGMRLAQQYGADALFVTADGEIVMTEGMEIFFSPFAG